MLHSTFWNHGAGALDLPPWALSMFPMPSDLPLRHDSTTPYGSKSRNSTKLEMASDLNEGMFLDFLYPPQALAWLQRSSGHQQLQRWERRNLRRLPEGFVVASRGYTSASYQPFPKVQHKEDLVRQKEGNEVTGENYEPHVEDVGVSELQTEQRAPQGQLGFSSDALFGDSPGELAEAVPNAMLGLRHMITNRNKSVLSDPQKSREAVERVWQLFESLDEDSRDMRLKQELLDWLALHDHEYAYSRCVDLYQSIPASERTSQIYASALSMFLKREQFHMASRLHMEALQNLENGHLISKILFSHAVENQLWQVAIRTKSQHHTTYTQMDRRSQIGVFWLHISETPRLLEKALQLAMYLRGIRGLRSADSHTRTFCARFFKEAILQQFLRPAEEPHSMTTWENFKLSRPPHETLRQLFRHIAEMDKDAGSFFEDTLTQMLRPDSRVDYKEYHTVVSFIYREYRKLRGVCPSRRLLLTFLQKLTRYEMQVRTNSESDLSVGIDFIVKDWEYFYRKLDKEAVALLLNFHAKTGELKKFERWLDYLRSVYPDYKDQKDVLWTMVYIHARRDDLDKAQQAFAEIKRIAAEHDDEPDLKCWNVLLHAHSRADDLEGALTNFQNLIDHAKLKPDSYSFNTLLPMLARRGDVPGVEDLIHQYDQLVGDKKDATMIAHLMEAHINNDDLKVAESILRETTPKLHDGRILGSSTRCFNVMLSAHANRRDINATMQTYNRMKKEGTILNGDSFGALIQVLTHYRQTAAALEILTTVMPEHNVEPTAFHYGIIMLGFVQKRMYKSALDLHMRMSRRNVRPSITTNVVYLKSKAYAEREEKRGEQSIDGEPVPLESSIEELQDMMQRYDGEEMAPKQPKSLVGTSDRVGAKTAAYFETLITLHGQRKCFEAVQDLFHQYKEAAKERGDGEEHPPLRILSALMSAHWHAGEYDKVEEYWKLAKDQADVIAPPVPVPSFRYYFSESSLNVDPFELKPSKTYPAEEAEAESESSTDRIDGTEDKERSPEPKQTEILAKDASQGRRPAPNRRQILNRPLRLYLAALTSQSRIVEAITTVSRLITQGYTMDKNTWNFFIECLLDTSPPLALLAFVFTERFLMPQFPGWAPMKKYPVSRQAKFEGLQHIRARYLRRDQLMPQYKTFVRLGAAMLDIRRMEALGRRGMVTDVPPELERFVGSTREIRRRAARTLFAVQSMPVIADWWQAKYLGRRGS